jgi:YegS/Rv2252/BmrU family lipid kinase
MKQQRKIAAIVNPYSGNGRTAKKWPELAALIENQIGPFAFLETQRAGDATGLVRQALRDGYDRIISVGGDGTHHEVLNGFFDGLLPINPRAAMAILPMGTGSDLARTLHIPKGRKAIPHLVSDRVVAADLGRVSFTLPNGGQQYLYFINICHIGMGGAVVHCVNNSSKQYGGFFTYLWGCLRTLLRFRCPYLELDIDGMQVDQVCRDVIVAKGQYDGGGMHVAPNAEIDNGHFDIFVIGETSRWFVLSRLYKIYLGRILDYPDRIKNFTAARVTARAKEPVLITLDGEQPGQLPAAIEMMPKALRIVTACPDHPVDVLEHREAPNARAVASEPERRSEPPAKPPPADSETLPEAPSGGRLRRLFKPRTTDPPSV